jgi:hypothetical protein
MREYSIFVLMVVLATTAAFSINRACALPGRSVCRISNSVVFRPSSALFATEPPEKITRESEAEEFFESEMDRKPFSEKLPAAMAFLGAVSLPFLVGLIYLYQNK